MGELVNLRTARKRAKRDRDERRAQENRLAHGRPTAERRLTDARDEKAQKDLDQHRIGRGEAP
jgi:hypothetical protein